MPNEYYVHAFEQARQSGCTTTEAVVRVAGLYLDEKPKGSGKRRVSQAERDKAFFSWRALEEIPGRSWADDALVLALAQYVGQDRVAAPGLLQHVASIAPDMVKRAIRLSGLVLKPASPRRAEVAELARVAPAEFAELVDTLAVFTKAHSERKDLVSRLWEPLSDLAPLEVMAYASLYAFKHLVAVDGAASAQHTQTTWTAVSRLLASKLAMSADETFNMTDGAIARSFGSHVSPFLFPTDGDPPRRDLLYSFEELMAAQIEMDEFVERSVIAFSIDHTINFVPKGDGLDIVELDKRQRKAAKEHWHVVNERLERLHRYWSLRGMEAFFESGLVERTIGRPENSELNRVACIKAMATQLLLVEVFGAGDTASTESGRKAPLFKALLSLEHMAAFFETAFVMPYREHLEHTGAWDRALGLLAMDGMSTGENRFPLTWSRRDEKARRIVGWTVDPEHPRGSRREAEAILDLWTTDCRALARRLRSDKPGLSPELYERPILKMGRYLFQLPWLTAFQNNRTAAVNNLGRLGARRPEARDETRRIEERLAALFRQRGFAVLLNHQPTATDGGGAGEVDLICGRDGGVLVLEVKSTFIRKSASEAWLHGTRTLQHAGRQLQGKVTASTRDPETATALGIDPAVGPTRVSAWIVDTSLEHDHEQFGGFLKVSVEELIIALRDDRHVLIEADRVFADDTESQPSDPDIEREAATLYADGFSFPAFVRVVESEAVWAHPVADAEGTVNE